MARALPTRETDEGRFLWSTSRGNALLEAGSEQDLLACYIVRYAPTLQIDNHTLGEPMSASDRGGTRALLTAAACTRSAIGKCLNSRNGSRIVRLRGLRPLSCRKVGMYWSYVRGFKRALPRQSGRDHVVCFVTFSATRGDASKILYKRWT